RAAVADDPLAERRRLVARLEDRGVHRVAVGAPRERAGRVAEEDDVRDRRPGERPVETRRIEDLDDGAPDARRRRIVGDRAVLPAARGGDEGAGVPRTREDDVPRLVAGEERPDDAGR